MDNLALEKDINSAGLIILGELQVTDNDPVPKQAPVSYTHLTLPTILLV